MDILNNPVAQCAVLMVVLAALLAAAFWGLRRFRDYIGQDQTNPSELLTNYREMHAQGVISDAEYRTIKSRLNAGMRHGSNESERAG